VRIAPSGDAAASLRPGAAAQATIESARKVGALVVPRAALGVDGPPHVLIVDGGVVKRVEVELGVQERDRVEVVRGLNDGDQVVLEAVELREGERVAVAAAH
jgi:multidrug efflux pump subunit AcrA (membrane-fusion protein)